MLFTLFANSATEFSLVHVSQYAIYSNHVKQLNRNEGILTVDNGEAIPIARAQKERLIERYRWLQKQCPLFRLPNTFCNFNGIAFILPHKLLP
ncbi:MAG TPA: hypothetical protein VGE06_04610 [Flavisolibacter sp.]